MSVILPRFTGPPKKVEPPKMIVETTRFNPSFCTCGEHGCEPRYRMERRVLWTNKEIVPNEKTQKRKDIREVKYAEEEKETSEHGKNIEDASRKYEDHINRDKEAEDVKDGEKEDHKKEDMEDCNDDGFNGCTASLVDSDKSEGKEVMGDTRRHIDDNSEKGENGDCNSYSKSLKDSDSDGAEFAARIYEKDKYNNDIEANCVNWRGGGPNEKYNRDIDGNKDSLVTRKTDDEENDMVKGNEWKDGADGNRLGDNDEEIYKYGKESNGKGVVRVRAVSGGVVDGMNHEFPVDNTVDSLIIESYRRNEDSGATAGTNNIYDLGNKLNSFRNNTSEKNDIRGHRRYDFNGVTYGGERHVVADDICKNGAVEDTGGKCFDEESNAEKSDDVSSATDIEKESNSDDASNRNDDFQSDSEIVTGEDGTDDETNEQTVQEDDCYKQGDEISPAFGIMSVYCNSELHSWTTADDDDGVWDTCR